MILTVDQINIKISLGMAVGIIPRRIKNRGYEKFGAANKVYYGRCANGEWLRLPIVL